METAIAILASIFWLVIVLVIGVILIWSTIIDTLNAWLDKFINIDFMGGNNTMHHPYENNSYEQFISLVHEIIRARYCKEVLNNPSMSEEVYSARMAKLRKLLWNHPEHNRWYSPTHYEGFDEKMASDAYGKTKWGEMKRTLNLTKPTFFYDVGEG